MSGIIMAVGPFVRAGRENKRRGGGGENVAVNLKGGNTWLFPLGGKMTLEGYDASTGSGFGTTYTDIASAVADGTSRP